MLRVGDRPAPSKSPVPVVPGMRRVSFVRIVVVDGRTRCEVVGTGHRLPAVRTVSLDTALALVAGGVPSVIRTRPDPAGRTES